MLSAGVILSDLENLSSICCIAMWESIERIRVGDGTLVSKSLHFCEVRTTNRFLENL